MDESNPAVMDQMRSGPADLEEVALDTKVITRQSRKMLFLQVQKTHTLMANPAIPIGQRLQFIDTLAKLADAYPKANAGAGQLPQGAGFSVSIVYNAPVPQANTHINSQDPAPTTVITAEVSDVTDVTAKNGD